MKRRKMLLASISFQTLFLLLTLNLVSGSRAIESSSSLEEEISLDSFAGIEDEQNSNNDNVNVNQQHIKSLLIDPKRIDIKEESNDNNNNNYNLLHLNKNNSKLIQIKFEAKPRISLNETKKSIEHNNNNNIKSFNVSEQENNNNNNNNINLNAIEENWPFDLTIIDEESNESNNNNNVNLIEKSNSLFDSKQNQIKSNSNDQSIDFIFPASNTNTNTNTNSNNKKENVDLTTFAWRQLPTDKCSKNCGRGRKMYHVSCLDLKYNVRVSDDLCLLKSRVPRPNETSEDEFCNEIDCAPNWLTIEGAKKCNIGKENECTDRVTFKRAQCVMIDRNGQTRELEDSKCDSSLLDKDSDSDSDSDSNTNSMNEQSELISFEDIVNGGDISGPSNEIIQTQSESHHPYQNQNHNYHHHHMNHHNLNHVEYSNQVRDGPFFEPTQWSECVGSKCGQVGKRHRKVKCRLYLSKSSRYVELAESSCRASGAIMPDTEEPCYLDCPSDDQPAIVELIAATNPDSLQSSNGSSSSKQAQSTDLDSEEDETIYDIEMSRFEWKHDGWTKCSADCLGGKRESLVECWDSMTKSRVEVSMCEPQLRPKPIVENCNEIACAPKWRVEAYGKCSHSCGSAGFRSRFVSCVQQVSVTTTKMKHSNFMTLSNDQCRDLDGGQMPPTREPCNRVDCRPEWIVGPWSDCNTKCGYGRKNRTVMCIQEFANRDGPSLKFNRKLPSSEMLEAIAEFAREDDWVPGKRAQIPFKECYDEYKMIPVLEERCFVPCKDEIFIDSDHKQDIHFTRESSRKRTVTVRIGGRATIYEGKNIKIRCRVMRRQWMSPQQDDDYTNQEAALVSKLSVPIDWRYLGHEIFPNSSQTTEKQYLSVQDESSIFIDNDIIGANAFDQDHTMMADEPRTKQANQQAQSKRARNLVVRSWPNRATSSLNDSNRSNVRFVPQLGGRFTLVRDSTLKISRLRQEDSGLYTCSHGSLSQSIELKVLSHRTRVILDETKLANDLTSL